MKKYSSGLWCWEKKFFLVSLAEICSCEPCLGDRKLTSNQVTQVHVNSPKEACTAVTGMLPSSTMLLTVMGLRVHLAISSRLCCVGWQLVYWQQSVYYLASCSTTQHQSLSCSHRPCTVGVPAAREASPRSAVSSDRGRKLSQPTHCSSSSSPSTHFEEPFVWSSNLVCQSCDAVWREDL